VKLVDREVDMIPGSSGLELEDQLLDRIPRATEVIVLPAPDGDPVPVISTADGKPISAEEWRAATAGLRKLADPVLIPWDEFPRTATWKVKRLELRERVLPGTQPLGTGHWT
jgi:hypothetical protein